MLHRNPGKGSLGDLTVAQILVSVGTSMRRRAAPEVRGSSCQGVHGLAGRIGSLALLFLICVSWLGGRAPASSPVESGPQRQLLAAPSAAQPTFALPDLSGSPLDLQQQAGRVVLVHFFATWCEPCREELASLSRLTQGPLGERVSVLAINVAEVPLRVRRFLDAAPVSFPVLLDTDRRVTRAWGVGVLPTTFVLDPDLKSRLFVEGDVDWSRVDIIAARSRRCIRKMPSETATEERERPNEH